MSNRNQGINLYKTLCNLTSLKTWSALSSEKSYSQLHVHQARRLWQGSLLSKLIWWLHENKEKDEWEGKLPFNNTCTKKNACAHKLSRTKLCHGSTAGSSRFPYWLYFSGTARPVVGQAQGQGGIGIVLVSPLQVINSYHTFNAIHARIIHLFHAW